MKNQEPEFAPYDAIVAMGRVAGKERVGSSGYSKQTRTLMALRARESPKN